MNELVRGTTPTFRFVFNTIKPEDIKKALFVMKKKNKEIVVLTETEQRQITQDAIEWTLTQEQSFRFSAGDEIHVYCDWLSVSDVRGRSKQYTCTVVETGHDEVMS